MKASEQFCDWKLKGLALTIGSLMLFTAFAALSQGALAQQTEWVLEDVVNKNTMEAQSLIIDNLGVPHIFVRPDFNSAKGNLTHFYRQDGVWYNETVIELRSLASIDAAFDALGNIHIVFNGKLSDDSTHLFYATNAGMPSGQWNVTLLSGNYLYTGAKMASGPGDGVTFCTWDQWTPQTRYFHAAYGQPLTFENVSVSYARYAPLDLCIGSDGSLHELFNAADSYLSEAFKNETGWHSRMIDAVNRTETGAMSIDGNDRLHVAYICSDRISYNDLIVQYASGDASGWGAPTNLAPFLISGYTNPDIDSRGDSRVAISYEMTDGIHVLDLDHGAVTSSSSPLYRSRATLKLDANYDVKMALRRGVGPELYVQYAYLREISTPGQPTGLIAQNDLATGEADLSWTAPISDGNSSITAYRIYRGNASGAQGSTPIATIGNMTSYVDASTQLGHTYWYQVSAVNSIGEGPRSTEASVQVGTLASAPRNLTIFSGLHSLSLYWEAPLSDGGGAPISYNVYMRIEGGTGDYELLGYGITESAWSWPSATYGFTFDFKVTCSNSFGEGPASNVASSRLSTLPTAPTLLSATPGDGQITLTWSSPSDDGGHPVTNYTIWRGTLPNDESELVKVGDVLTYTDTGLVNGQAYYYRVQAATILGAGISSNELSATPAAATTAPSAPQGLQALYGIGTVILTWSAPSDDGGLPITGYKILRGTSVSNLEVIGTTTSTSYADSTVTPGISYTYGVMAVNSAGDGSMATIPGVLVPVPMFQITGVIVDDGGNAIAGATVSLENGSQAISDSQGQFNIMADNGSHTLTISGNGMVTKTVTVSVDQADENVGTIALASTPSDNTTMYLLLGGGVALILIVIILLFWMQRRRKGGNEKEEGEKKQ